MDRQALEAERADLQRQLKKRQQAAGHSSSIAMIKNRLAAIETELSNDASPIEP